MTDPNSERLLDPDSKPDDNLDYALRPHSLKDMIGQNQIRENLEILISAAQHREEALDHVLFYGPPGLGKTTLAHILAVEMGVNIKITSGPAIERAGDLAAILTNLNEGDILFIDEIHRLGRAVEEVLYPKGRGGSTLPSYGGLLPGYHHWQRSISQISQVKITTLYNRWSHNSSSTGNCSLTRQIWSGLSFGLLHDRINPKNHQSSIKKAASTFGSGRHY
jgi:hypothetical protein